MERRSAGTRGLVFGALMAALVILCAVIPVPFGIFMPIPLVLAYVRYGGRVAFLTAIVAGLFCAMFVGLAETFLLIPGGILPGLVFGYGFRNKLRPLYVGITAVVASFVGFAIWYVVMRGMVLGGQDPIVNLFQSQPAQELIGAVANGMEQQLSAVKPANDTEAANQQLQREYIQQMRTNPAGLAMVVLPASLFLGGAASAWINYKLCRLVLPRFGHNIPDPTPFGEFRLPAWLTWAFVIILYGSRLAPIPTSVLESAWWFKLLLNVVGTLLYVFVLAGISTAYGYLRKRGTPKPAAAALSLLGFLAGFNLAFNLYMMLAMWDTIFDFRGLGHGMLKRSDDTP